MRVMTLTLAAALVGAGAWASVENGGLRAIIEDIVELREPAAPRKDDAPAPPVPRRRSAPGAPRAPGPELEAPALETPIEVGPPSAIGESAGPGSEPTEPRGLTARSRSVAGARVATPVAPAPAPVPAPTGPAPALDVDALYRAAHEAHFTRRDYVNAIAAWDRYLAAAGPGSRMLIEARYNRGIALARVGRSDEAIQALKPFADGEYGEYRRSEARRVIEKIGRR
jgi:hypothetical protein